MLRGGFLKQMTDIEDKDNAGIRQWPLAALTVLQLGNMRLAQGDGLLSWLRGRANAGYPLADLTLFVCEADHAYLERLRAVPGQVVHQSEREPEKKGDVARTDCRRSDATIV
ncbi:hypothetical protein FA95DRAFT_817694 [Auriscalpium vulgare]|uniref:Uncharacterized protein n=1 Tax=Auriscalpium vulgare TaxID=40419 RepID=A0ACB8S122_9AGAM|nr:hypothetical protein FA95DRAFT_817694 [Auriscalpium vulgare]